MRSPKNEQTYVVYTVKQLKEALSNFDDNTVIKGDFDECLTVRKWYDDNEKPLCVMNFEDEDDIVDEEEDGFEEPADYFEIDPNAGTVDLDISSDEYTAI